MANYNNFPVLDCEHPDYEYLKATITGPDSIQFLDISEDTWMDDHILCFGYIVTPKTTPEHPSRPIKVGAWWAGAEGFATAIRATEGNRDSLVKFVTGMMGEIKDG